MTKMWHGLLVWALGGGLCCAQTFDIHGASEVLPSEYDSDWVFIGSSLVDVVDNIFKGVIGVSNGGMGSSFTFSPDNRYMFAVERFYSRGNRGERTEMVTVFDTSKLSAVDEIIIPSKSAMIGSIDGATALSDENRFLAVFNLTPATSLTIVDTEARKFVGEISTPGCSLVYAAGERRYVMLCTNGGLLTVTLDEDGNELSKVRTAGYFDPEVDPITEAGVRYGDQWLFVSFDGMVYPLDVSGAAPRFKDTWSLLTDEDRLDNWRIAGNQHLTVHQGTGRLYSLVRQSEDPLDDPGDMDGTEIWVYDIESHQRVRRFEAVPQRDSEKGNIWRTLVRFVTGNVADDEGANGGTGGIGSTSGDGASGILVTQGDDPVLVTVGGGVSVRNVITGEYIHERLKNVPQSGRLTPRN